MFWVDLSDILGLKKHWLFHVNHITAKYHSWPRTAKWHKKNAGVRPYHKTYAYTFASAYVSTIPE